MNPAIEFPDADPMYGIINCNSNPVRGIRVKIGSLTGVQVGAVLKLSWLGYKDREGKEPIPETATSLNHFVTPEDINKGLIKTIGDYYKHIKPIRDGSARAAYTINGGESTKAHVQVVLVDAAGDFCPEE
ncbi:hypothetical protein [Pseudomonas sp. LB3P14]